MPTGVEVVSNDGKTNASAEVWSAYDESATLEPASHEADAEGDGFGPLSVGAPEEEPQPAEPRERRKPEHPAQQTLSKAHVEYMTTDPAAWKLRVRVSESEGEQVISRDDLKATWERSTAKKLAKHQLRMPNSGEARALAWDAANGPGGTDGLLKELAGVPAGLVGAVASAAALGQADSANDDLLTIAVLLFIAATGFATFGCARVRLVKVFASRLDQLQERFDKAQETQLSRWRLPVLLSIAGAVFAGLAFVFPGGPAAASAGIRVADVDRNASGLTAIVEVEWENLPEAATAVNTTISGGLSPVDRDARNIDDGAVTQRLRVRLARAGEIEVTTKALNSSGERVGQEVDESLRVE
jgi:hypothetical protein